MTYGMEEVEHDYHCMWIIFWEWDLYSAKGIENLETLRCLSYYSSIATVQTRVENFRGVESTDM